MHRPLFLPALPWYPYPRDEGARSAEQHKWMGPRGREEARDSVTSLSADAGCPELKLGVRPYLPISAADRLQRASLCLFPPLFGLGPDFGLHLHLPLIISMSSSTVDWEKSQIFLV